MDVAAEKTSHTFLDEDQFHDAHSIAPTSPKVHTMSQSTSSPQKMWSPVKYRLNDDQDSVPHSPRDEPQEETPRLTKTVTNVQMDGITEEDTMARNNGQPLQLQEQHTSQSNGQPNYADETDLTLGFNDKTFQDETLGDLSTISAIPADLTRFANLQTSPTKRPGDAWSPSKQLRTSVMSNAHSTVNRHSQNLSQRPLQLVSRHSESSTDGDEESTPRRPRSFNDSPTDLLNFTGQSNILIPPPGSAPRTTRRSPSGRGAFPVRVNPSPTHRSQASIDRDRTIGRSPQKQAGALAERTVPQTPSEARRSIHATNGLGLDLLDLEVEPLATPRSIPTVTPRELETLRSELQSRISGLDATLSGKEAEVQALKRSVTDAEVRVGKASEDLRTERAAKEDIEREKVDLERRTREMEDVLREVKQNAFVEERERDKMRREVAESERKADEAEIKILELTASLQTLRDDRIKNIPSPFKNGDPSTPGTVHGAVDIDAAVKQATESVARELHALYRGKHERKVADLKVSYEKRWNRKFEDLQQELKKSQDEILKLITERDATMSGVLPGQAQAERARDQKEIESLMAKSEKAEAEKKMLQAQVTGLEEQVGTLRAECYGLRKEVEQERIEKGELVGQIDLFLTMSEAEKEAVRKPLPESPPQDPELEHQQHRRQHRQQVSIDSHLRPQPHQQQMHGQSPSPSKASKRMSLSGAPLSSGYGQQVPSKPRPMSMLKAPAGGKFSGIPPPGSKAGAGSAGTSRFGGGKGIMEGIARMGAGR